MKLHTLVLMLLSALLFSVPAWADVTEQQVAEVYVATFNRAPDAAGLSYWVNDSFAGDPPRSIERIAMSFFDQPETQALYPPGNTNSQFVTSIYQNLFNRGPDAAGLAYWIGKDGLGGTMARSVMIEALKNGAQGTDAVIIANKAEVGLYYVAAGIEGNDFSLADVTDDPATVIAAKEIIDTLKSGGTGTLSLGAPEELATENILPAGGMITVNNPANPLHAMEIIVPPGAYTAAKPFRVSSTPITGHTFGPLFQPLTPLITIDNGGAHAEESMMVQIPVQIPAGHFAMAFFYDEAQGKLEPMQLISVGTDSITVATRHFSSFTVTGIAQSVLDTYLAAGIRSGFYPGVDDWSFVNRGSYIAPGGHCAGQSLGALWYFTEKTDGPGHLWESYDNNYRDWRTLDFWQDDSYAYRFCSMLQKDIDWDSFSMDFWNEAQGRVWRFVDNQWKLVNVPALSPAATRNLFALSMLLTDREPQFVGIYSNAGGGHAMIVYAVTQDALHIADPNYPGDINRVIYFNNGAFDPYPSGDNWEEINAGRGKNYEHILYLAKSTVLPWDTIAERWLQAQYGAIGDTVFPNYQIKYLDDLTGDFQLLTEGQVVTQNKIRIAAVGDGTATIGNQIYKDGKLMTFDADWKVDLNPGDNLLGIGVLGQVGEKWKYVDFVYYNVIYNPETLTGAFNFLNTWAKKHFPSGWNIAVDTIDFSANVNGRVVNAQNPVITLKDYYNSNNSKIVEVTNMKRNEVVTVSGTINMALSTFIVSPEAPKTRMVYTYSNPRLVRYVSGVYQETYPGMNFTWVVASDGIYNSTDLFVEYDVKTDRYVRDEETDPFVFSDSSNAKSQEFHLTIKVNKDVPDWDTP